MSIYSLIPLANQNGGVHVIEEATRQMWGLVPWVIGFGALSLLFTALSRALLPKLKGDVGEWVVNRSLLSHLPREVYQVIPDLLLPDGKGGYTQIDHVVISRFGLFVIETKNWSGWVFGGEKDPYWTLSYPGRRKVRMLNPLHQNALHVRVIRELLQMPPQHCHNLVFINSAAKLKKGPVEGVFQQGLTAYIRLYQDSVFSSEWVHNSVSQLQSACQSKNAQARAAHLRQVKEKK